MTQTLGWIANFLFFYGVYSLGKKNIIGFYCNTIANILYLWQSIIISNWALLGLSIGLSIVNIMGIWEWSKKGNTNV